MNIKVNAPPPFATETVNNIDLKYGQWHSTIGRVLIDFRDQIFGEEYVDFDVWLDCAPLLDWISLEYASRSYSDDRVILPTEMLNADGSRAFGRLCRSGFSGSCYVVGSESSDTVRKIASFTSRDTPWLHVQIQQNAEEKWDICARAFSPCTTV